MVALLATISDGQFLHDHHAGHFPYPSQFGSFPPVPNKEDQKYQIDDAQNSAVVVQSSDLDSDGKPSDSDVAQSPSNNNIYNPSSFYNPQHQGFYQPKPHPFYQHRPIRFGYPGYYPFFNPFYQFGIPQHQYSPFYQPSPYSGFLNYPNRGQQPYHPLANKYQHNKPIYNGVQPYPAQQNKDKTHQHPLIRPNFQFGHPYLDGYSHAFDHKFPKKEADVGNKKDSVVIAAKESVIPVNDGFEKVQKEEDDLMGSLTQKQIDGLYRLLG